MATTKNDANVKEELRARLVDSFYIQNEQISILKHDSGLVYLMGSHHNQEKYAYVASHLISQIRPHVVAVELCRTNLERYNVPETTLKPATTSAIYQPAKTTYMDFIPKRLKQKAIGEELLLGLIIEALKYERYCAYKDHMKLSILRKNMSKFKLKPKVFHSNVKIGGEMTVPFGELVWQIDKRNPLYLINAASPYKIMLADKPVEETFCKIAAALSEDEKKIIRIYQTNFLRLFITFSGKRTLMLSLLDRNDVLRKAILNDRDMYMAKALMKALLEIKPKTAGTKSRIVGIVGKSHVPGIMKCWQNILLTQKISKKAIHKNKPKPPVQKNKPLVQKNKPAKGVKRKQRK